MNIPTLFDVPLEVPNFPFCNGTLPAEVSAPTQVGGKLKVVVYFRDVHDVTSERLEPFIRRDQPGRWEPTEAAARAWLQARSRSAQS